MPQTPQTPTQPQEADKADPGDSAEIQQQRQDAAQAKLDSTKVGQGADSAGGEKKKTWVEFQLLDAADKPLKGEKCKLTLPDGKEKEASTNDQGIVRVNDIDPGPVTIRLPNRYDDEWNFLRTEDSS
jgi:hypothetical protein